MVSGYGEGQVRLVIIGVVPGEEGWVSTLT